MTPPAILILAGEKSGDNYGAALVRRFQSLYPGASFFGVGGSAMAAAGVDRLFPMEDLGLIGLVEIVGHLPRLRRMQEALVREADRRKPAAAVLIDSPDFNLPLAKRLKARGIPVLYYISPTIWAWRPGRLKKIRKRVAKMLLIFPFEERLYAEAGIPARFVGHPLLERIRTVRDRDAVRAGHGIDPGRPLVVLMPGSRRGEVARHMPLLAKAVPLIRRATQARFLLIRAEDLDEAFLRRFLPPGLADVSIVDQGAYDAIAAADLVLSACGTANLEAALLGTPLVAFYKVAPLTSFLGRRLLRIRVFSIVNILAGKTLVPELIQRDFTSERLAAEAIRLLRSPEERARLQALFARLKTDLGTEPASENAARELLNLIAS